MFLHCRRAFVSAAKAVLPVVGALFGLPGCGDASRAVANPSVKHAPSEAEVREYLAPIRNEYPRTMEPGTLAVESSAQPDGSVRVSFRLEMVLSEDLYQHADLDSALAAALGGDEAAYRAAAERIERLPDLLKRKLRPAFQASQSTDYTIVLVRRAASKGQKVSIRGAASARYVIDKWVFGQPDALDLEQFPSGSPLASFSQGKDKKTVVAESAEGKNALATLVEPRRALAREVTKAVEEANNALKALFRGQEGAKPFTGQCEWNKVDHLAFKIGDYELRLRVMRFNEADGSITGEIAWAGRYKGKEVSATKAVTGTIEDGRLVLNKTALVTQSGSDAWITGISHRLESREGPGKTVVLAGKCKSPDERYYGEVVLSR